MQHFFCSSDCGLTQKQEDQNLEALATLLVAMSLSRAEAVALTVRKISQTLWQLPTDKGLPRCSCC